MLTFKRFALFAMSPLMMKTAAAESAPASAARLGKVLLVMTSHDRYPDRNDGTGLWLAELTHVYDVLTATGYAVDFVSPKGGAVPLDPRSLGWPHADAAAKARLRDPAFMARLQATRAAADIDPDAYLAIFYTGGHGTMWDFRDNQALKRAAESIYRHGGIVASVCHGAAGLLELEADDGRPLIAGRRVTGFSNLEETLSGVKDRALLAAERAGSPRRALRKSWSPFGSFVLTDGRIVTGQNPGSSKEVARALLAALPAAHSRQADDQPGLGQDAHENR